MRRPWLVVVLGVMPIADAFAQRPAEGAGKGAVSASAGDAGSLAATHVMRLTRPTSLIVIDGRLDEAAWASAPIATGFVQQRPTPEAPAAQRTEARVLVGSDALYVGMRLYDSAPDSIAAPLLRRYGE